MEEIGLHKMIGTYVLGEDSALALYNIASALKTKGTEDNNAFMLFCSRNIKDILGVYNEPDQRKNFSLRRK